MTENPINWDLVSPLGDLSSIYRIKQVDKYSIWDQPDICVLELYPSGYSQFSSRDNINRQRTLQQIYEAAVVSKSEDEQYPFKNIDHDIEIVHDPDNPFDNNALHVTLWAGDGLLKELSGKDLGFIPRLINRNMLQNIKMINKGKIYKVCKNFNDKFYTVKVIFPYGSTSFSNKIESKTTRRFQAIVEE